MLCNWLDECEIVGRSNQDGFAISDETSERTIKRPLVEFDDAPLSARKVNSYSHSWKPGTFVSTAGERALGRELTPSQNWHAHPEFSTRAPPVQGGPWSLPCAGVIVLA